jgi:integrase
LLIVLVFAAVVASARDDEGQLLYPHKWDRKFLGLPKIDKGKQKRPAYTAAEIETIIARALSRDESREAMLYALLAASGLRVGEAMALKVAHFTGDSLEIKKSLWNGVLYDPKTSNGIRIVDLAPELAESLRAFLGTRKSGYIFQTANGKPLHQSNVLRRSLHPILASMGRGEDWKAGFHGFRRFRVTWLRQHSVPEQLIAFWIGHAREKTVTDGYSRICDDSGFRKSLSEQVGSGLPNGIWEKLAMLDPDGPLASHLQTSTQVFVN